MRRFLLGTRNRFEAFDIKVLGIKELELVTDNYEGINAGDNGLWLEPRLQRARSAAKLRLD